MFVFILTVIYTVVRSADSVCSSGCGVCCNGECCRPGLSCCLNSCQSSCSTDKTTVWIIVGIVVAVIIALISVCLIIACIYCCSRGPQRQGTTVRKMRHPPARVRKAYAESNGRAAGAPHHSDRDHNAHSPRVWSLSDPSRNLTFSRHSPAFAPPPPGFVVHEGTATYPPQPPPSSPSPSSSRLQGYQNPPRSPRIPPAPLPDEFFRRDSENGENLEKGFAASGRPKRKGSVVSHSDDRKESVNSNPNPDEESESFSSASLDQSRPLSHKRLTASAVPTTADVHARPQSRSDKPVFTRSPRISTPTGLAVTSSSRAGAKISTTSIGAMSARNIEITSLDSDG